MVVGAILVFGYNLELFGGPMHSDFWFGLAWGSFPVAGRRVRPALDAAAGGVLIGAAAAFFLSMGQRALSTPARALRRRVSHGVGPDHLA